MSMAEECQAAHTEVPTIWNERLHAQVQMDNGVHGVYGGVQFGLEKFSLARPGAPQRSVLAGVATRPGLRAPLTARAARMAFAPSVLRPEARGVAPRAGVATRPGLRAPLTARAARMAFAPSVLRPEARGVAPRGVDLNLGEFDLSEATATDRHVEALWSEEEACLVLGKAFFECVDGFVTEDGIKMFTAKDEKLLKTIFNPNMSDRREEGDRFVPPDNSFAYVQKLRNLVMEEESVQAKRTEHFFSTKFSASEAGALFPSSWTSQLQIARGGMKAVDELHARPEFLAEKSEVEEIKTSASKAFEKSTEDGMCFRIYRKGGLELRTTQAFDGEETVG